MDPVPGHSGATGPARPGRSESRVVRTPALVAGLALVALQAVALVAGLALVALLAVGGGGDPFLELLDLEAIRLHFFAWLHAVTSWKLDTAGTLIEATRPSRGRPSSARVVGHGEVQFAVPLPFRCCGRKPETQRPARGRPLRGSVGRLTGRCGWPPPRRSGAPADGCRRGSWLWSR